MKSPRARFWWFILCSQFRLNRQITSFTILISDNIFLWGRIAVVVIYWVLIMVQSCARFLHVVSHLTPTTITGHKCYYQGLRDGGQGLQQVHACLASIAVQQVTPKIQAQSPECVGETQTGIRIYKHVQWGHFHNCILTCAFKWADKFCPSISDTPLKPVKPPSLSCCRQSNTEQVLPSASWGGLRRTCKCILPSPSNKEEPLLLGWWPNLGPLVCSGCPWPSSCEAQSLSTLQPARDWLTSWVSCLITQHSYLWIWK